jgi:hypothetical protein
MNKMKVCHVSIDSTERSHRRDSDTILKVEASDVKRVEEG